MYDVMFPNIGINIEHLPRIAFKILGMPLYFYGIIIGLGLVCGTLYAVQEAKRTGQNPDIYTNFLIYAIIACVIGARLYYVIFQWDNYKDDLTKIFALREGGLAIYGAVIAAVITAAVYTKKSRINFWLFADTAAPGLLLGQAIGRWGNFFNREAFGRFTDNLLAMRYLKEQVDFVPPVVMDKLVTFNGAEYIQVHPTFLYESLWSFFVFICINIYKRHKKFDGEIFALYFLGYGIGRFFIEGLRTDSLYLWGTHIAVSQLLSLVLVVAALVFIAYKRFKPRKLNA